MDKSNAKCQSSNAIWRGRRLLSDRGYRMLIGTCAVFLIVFSCLFAWSRVQKLII
jgi:hypothetical protein